MSPKGRIGPILKDSILAAIAAIALTCAYSGVYSAALPGKKGGGCLSDQAG